MNFVSYTAYVIHFYNTKEYTIVPFFVTCGYYSSFGISILTSNLH